MSNEVTETWVLDNVERLPADHRIQGWNLHGIGDIGGAVTLPTCELPPGHPQVGDRITWWHPQVPDYGAIYRITGWALNDGPRMPWWHWDSEQERVVWGDQS